MWLYDVYIFTQNHPHPNKLAKASHHSLAEVLAWSQENGDTLWPLH